MEPKLVRVYEFSSKIATRTTELGIGLKNLTGSLKIRCLSIPTEPEETRARRGKDRNSLNGKMVGRRLTGGMGFFGTNKTNF
jgi:hypothetical protein